MSSPPRESDESHERQWREAEQRNGVLARARG